MSHPLRKFRKDDLKLSLRDFARETGASKSKICRIERREQDADLDFLRQVVALGRRRRIDVSLEGFLAVPPLRKAAS